jgi:DegV family protein with EDD domain
MKVCILTDEISQFMDLSFRGQEHVHLMPVTVNLPEHLEKSGEKVRAHQLPNSYPVNGLYSLTLPGVDDFLRVYQHLFREYDEILVLLSAAWMTGTMGSALKAARQAKASSKIEIVDSEAVSVGLGMLVSVAAELAEDGLPAKVIKKEIMGIVPHIYSMFCLRSLSYLEPLGVIKQPQALVAEMLEVTQAFYGNQGRLIPVQKIRNSRHMIEFVQEFVGEFGDPRHIALLQGGSFFQQEIRSLRDRISQDYPKAQITEHKISLPLGYLIGPQSFGLFLWEGND